MPVTRVQETCTRNLHVGHSDLQQDFSCASFLHSRARFLHETEHVLFDVLVQETGIKNLMQVSCKFVTGVGDMPEEVHLPFASFLEMILE